MKLTSLPHHMRLVVGTDLQEIVVHFDPHDIFPRRGKSPCSPSRNVIK